MILTREGIQRMIDGVGNGAAGGGGGDISALLAGYATESWVDENYLSIEFFSKLFKAYNSANPAVEIKPNDTQSTITNIKAMFGFWTEQYLSALGQNAGGGGGGSDTLADLLDVELTTPTDNQVLTYYNGKWRNMASSAVDMNAVWSALGDNTTTQQIAASHLSTVLSDYVTLATAQTISGKKTMTGGLIVDGRVYQSGDDEGIIIKPQTSGYAALCLGSHNGRRSVFYLNNSNAFWRYSDGTNIYDINHPYKAGTIALTTDITNALTDYVTLATDQTISGKKTFSGGLWVTGRVTTLSYDDGLVIKIPSTTYVGITLHNGETESANIVQSEFLINTSTKASQWVFYKNGVTRVIDHPFKTGTIALTSDLDAYLPLTGGTLTGKLTVNAVIFGYNGINNYNQAAFVFDKPSSYFTGIGAHNTTNDLIWFGACTNDGVWQDSYKQIWCFNGTVQTEALKIGDIYIAQDSNGNLEFYKLNGTTHIAANIYATGGVSALGYGVSGGGGAGDVTWDLLADNTDTRQIALSHLTTALSGYAVVGDIPTDNNQLTNGAGYITSSDNCNGANKLLYYDTVYDFSSLDSFHEGNVLKCTTWNNFSIKGSGSASNGIIIDLGWTGNSSTSFGAQIAIDDDPTYEMYLRQRNQSGWAAWKRIMFSDGEGANGTWGISISGNALTATTLETARTLWGQSFDGSANISGNMTGVGNVTFDNMSRITYSVAGSGNHELFIGDSNNIGWVRFQDMCSQTGSSGTTYWAIKQNGNAYFLNVTASLTGNASTATALQTSRTLWGQSFNGSANVSGDMSAVGHITMDDEKRITFGSNSSTTSTALYIGTSGNYGWVRFQDMCSQIGTAGTTYWAIQQNGNATFKSVTSTFTGNLTGDVTGNLNGSADMVDNLHGEDFFRAYTRAGYNVNIQYDAGLYLLVNGSNSPTGTNYGSLLVLPYYERYHNTYPNFGVQIYAPNGDDPNYPNSLWFRTSLRNTWNNWYRVVAQNGSGDVGIGTESPSYKLHVVGDIYSSSVVYANQGVELNTGTYSASIGGYIDFHYGGTSNDYSVRIIEETANILSIDAKQVRGGTATRAGLVVGGGQNASYIQIGNGRIVWDSANQALRVTSADGTATNIYATGGVSALGMNTIATDGSVGATLVPSTTATYDLGSSSYKWRNLYMSGNGTNFSITNNPNYTYLGTSKYFSFGGDIYLDVYGIHIGNINRNYDLYVDGETGKGYFYGQLWAASFNQNSDMRLKNVLADFRLSVDAVANAPLFRYTFKNRDNRVMAGTSAQYWQIILPQTVYSDAEGMLSLDYGVTALAGVISVAREVSEHERRIAKLEAENATLRAEIEDLKAA